MNQRYVCYCGLYCENCAVKAKIEPAAKVLYDEMKQAMFEDIIGSIPNGEPFWAFLKSMAEEGTCLSCREGSGNPGCQIRPCAQERKVDLCALCHSYPCKHFEELLAGYPPLRGDNEVLRTKGIEEWNRLQDRRRAEGYTYPYTDFGPE